VIGGSRWLLMGALLSAALVGCDDGGDERPGPAPRLSARIVVSHDDGSLPRQCGVRTTAERVLAFEDAFNRGDARALDSLVADADHFQWYAVADGGTGRDGGYGGEGRTSAREASPPDERGKVLRELVERARRGERMQFLEIQVGRVAPRSWFPNIDQEVTGIEFTIKRDGPDIAALGGENRLGGGKAGFGCSDGRLLALATGMQLAHAPDSATQWLCRKGRRQREHVRPETPRRVVACTI
jgi:hypothetical protein